MTGNKGEWSEIYVFLKLLADGKLSAADANLEAIPDVFYPILKILRQEVNNRREYKISDEIKILEGNTRTEIASFPISAFLEYSQLLFDQLKKASGASFAFPHIEGFLRVIDVNTLKAVSSDKSDIQVVVHDLNTGLTPKLGFSIKSMLGKDSTLFNAGQTTNFIYELVLGRDVLDEVFEPSLVDDINSIEDSPKIVNRINKLKELGFSIEFSHIQSKNLELNLQLIDSDLPKILAELLLIKFSNKGVASISSLLQKVKEENPLNYDLSLGHPFYDYKIRNFLTDAALGMTPASIWTGKYDATGGIIIVKETGDLVCYHIYNRNEFQDYLLNHTKLEQASTSRYGYGDLYEENGSLFLKLNLQVRFN
jgi:hypothetical protein